MSPPTHGQRVVTGRRLMQAAGDILLGWPHGAADGEGRERDYYCRQLRDWRGSGEVDEMGAPGMAIYGRLCAWTLARAHARSGDRIAIASYLGKADTFDRAVVEFVNAYADHSERDHQQLVGAVDSGRVTAHKGL